MAKRIPVEDQRQIVAAFVNSGLTQKVFASQIGISHSALNRYIKVHAAAAETPGDRPEEDVVNGLQKIISTLRDEVEELQKARNFLEDARDKAQIDAERRRRLLDDEACVVQQLRDDLRTRDQRLAEQANTIMELDHQLADVQGERSALVRVITMLGRTMPGT